MIIFLYGSDTYRSRQKLNEIIEHYQKVHKSGLNLKYFDNQKLDYQDFKNELRTAPMFKEKKLVILTDALSDLEFKENFIKNSEEVVNLKDIILLFYENRKVPPDNSLFAFLKKHAKCQEFKPLERSGLKRWLKKEIENHRAKIDPGAVEKLINFVGNDLWQMSNEIKKLVAFKKDEKIEIEDIELLIKPKIETDIFKTIDAIASKDRKQALFLIHKHLEAGDNHLYLLQMISFQFRNLLIIKDLTEKSKQYDIILKESGLHPYVFRKSYWQTEKFTMTELKKIYRRIFQVDLDIKTGKIDPQTALDLLITEI